MGWKKSYWDHTRLPDISLYTSWRCYAACAYALHRYSIPIVALSLLNSQSQAALFRKNLLFNSSFISFLIHRWITSRRIPWRQYKRPVTINSALDQSWVVMESRTAFIRMTCLGLLFLFPRGYPGSCHFHGEIFFRVTPTTADCLSPWIWTYRYWAAKNKFFKSG